MNWPNLLYVLAKRSRMDISKEDVESLSSESKREPLCSDPITKARHFSQRFQKFMAFLKGPSKPIGEVVDYFCRVEFQLRGSPHIHSLWWVKDTPNPFLAHGCCFAIGREYFYVQFGVLPKIGEANPPSKYSNES